MPARKVRVGTGNVRRHDLDWCRSAQCSIECRVHILEVEIARECGEVAREGEAVGLVIRVLCAERAGAGDGAGERRVGGDVGELQRGAGQSKACACAAASAAARAISLTDFMATYSFPKRYDGVNSTIRRESLQPAPPQRARCPLSQSGNRNGRDARCPSKPPRWRLPMREGRDLSRPSARETPGDQGQRMMSIVPPLMPWRTRSMPEPEIQLSVLYAGRPASGPP